MTSPRASLVELAASLEDAVHRGGWGGPPVLVAVIAGEEAPVAMPVPPASGDLVADLLGFVAPPDWEAVGVVVEGAARSYRAGEVAGYRHCSSERPDRCRVVHLVDRTGESVALLRREGEEPSPLAPDDSGGGRMVDTCRRMLGLPTAPPPDSTHELWAAMWLDRIVADAADPARSGPVASWEDAVVRHPAAEAVLQADELLRPQVVRHLDALGRAMDAARPWTHLREECAAGRWAVPGVTPEVAAWMDDGMFARWATSEFPLLPELLEALADLVPSGVLRRIRAVLTAWGTVSHAA